MLVLARKWLIHDVGISIEYIEREVYLLIGTGHMVTLSHETKLQEIHIWRSPIFYQRIVNKAVSDLPHYAFPIQACPYKI